MSTDLLPCPFCGGGQTTIDETHMPPRMSGPGALVSVEVRHWCDPLPGMLGRSNVVMAGRDHETAIAAWNRRARGEEQREAIAAEVEPKGPRPCTCTVCDCGDRGAAQQVALWDEAVRMAAAIRAREPKP